MNNHQHYRILLFDLSTTGHHAFWVSCLGNDLCDKGHEVHFMTLVYDDKVDMAVSQPNFKQIPIDNNAQAIRESKFIKRNLQMFFSLKQCLTYAGSWKADIVHILYMDHNIVPIYFLSLGSRLHKIGRMVGLLFWPFFVEETAMSQNISKRIYRALNRIFLRKLLRRKVLAALFVLSPNLQNKIIETLKLEHPDRDKIVSIPDPVLMFSDICSRDEARNRLNLPTDANILLFFGVLSKDKGFDILLEAIQNIEKPFTLLVAGRVVDFDPSDMEKLKEHGPRHIDIVTRFGHIPDEDVPYFFLSADAVVLPYRKSYLGMSGVLQQSCGAGKPVIASDVGEIGEMVRRYNLGFLVEPESVSSLKQGISHFLEMDKKSADACRQDLLNYAQRHHWSVMTEKVEQAYSQIMQGNIGPKGN
jgi:glycosyltransferase involved in cell wall biosynthesis